jgi:hypothetical protein
MTYNTISEAAQAVSIHGVSGAVVFEIANGTYDDIIHLTSISGASASNTVNVQAGLRRDRNAHTEERKREQYLGRGIRRCDHPFGRNTICLI